MAGSILGNRVLRKEDPKFLTTGGVYVDDLNSEPLLVGALHATFVRSTVAHAKSVAEVFNDHRVKTVLIHGDLSETERKDTLFSFEQGDAKVIVNVSVLTEGWDYQPTSCVVLLRPSSYKSTMIQMIGRGLRVVDQEIYPNVIKEDCIILDFGTSSLIHGCLEVDVTLEKSKKTKKNGKCK